MNYVLALLTHGRRDTLTDSFHSFVSKMKDPSSIVLYADGAEARARIARTRFDGRWLISYGTGSGFCTATGRLWELAVKEAEEVGATHVFWLEHDFVLTRDVDVESMARVMAAQSAFSGDPLAQMALMRDAVNEQERAAGGLYESRRGDYRSEGGWLSHGAYFTTNPSLMSVGFMRDNPWPDYPSECEGRFGIDLVNAGYRFGVWGDGSPFVRHIGERDGHGY